ncbi:hypothetical protein [Actinoplanes sp. RD1]|uniref:hypothetical protein n=1 Tax=Actinoplanes sp. RD1 TaxID=3064538 RepID=UPI00274097EF|nr:hypothetical protein [Actinoplanes sp. RD1]
MRTATKITLAAAGTVTAGLIGITALGAWYGTTPAYKAQLAAQQSADARESAASSARQVEAERQAQAEASRKAEADRVAAAEATRKAEADRMAAEQAAAAKAEQDRKAAAEQARQEKLESDAFEVFDRVDGACSDIEDARQARACGTKTGNAVKGTQLRAAVNKLADDRGKYVSAEWVKAAQAGQSETARLWMSAKQAMDGLYVATL